MQKFDAAMTAGDVAAVSAQLPDVWAKMVEAELEVAFAALYAEGLLALPLTGDAAELAFRIGLLSPLYERAAAEHVPTDLTETFLVALARGIA